MGFYTKIANQLISSASIATQLTKDIGLNHSFQEGSKKLNVRLNFLAFKQQLKNQGVSEKYIKENQEILEKKYMEIRNGQHL